MEDIASIVITSFSATLHSQLLLEAARHGISLIICESFKPTSLLLPANRSTDTLLTRAQVDLPDKLKERLWFKTVDAKCQNQYALARHIAPNDNRLRELKLAASGKHASKESASARIFWGILGRTVDSPLFRRERHGGGLNNLLNYGYAVLLSSILQKLFGVGLDPTFGIAHAIRERSTPLAYDLMEPFRPCVDWRIFQWVREHPDPKEWNVTKEYRAWVTSFPLDVIEHMDLELEVQGCIEGCVRGFRKAVMEKKARLYRPWTLKNSKWAG
jgi:CRISPR-associated protein Cas1